MDPLAEHDPKRVGPYRLLGRLGAGGMGQVYLGAGRHDQRVAIKVVHPGLAHDDRFRSRFRREVEVSRQVSGPWVAAVVDADPDAPTPWLATQYVRGPSLATVVETGGPLSAERAHALAHGLAMGLAAVHGAGLVHRDLKPSNVLLDEDHPRLIDFGISRAIDGTRITTTGLIIGTPAFMSPEQIAGQDAGPASDVFSLGAMLAFVATGRSPFGDHPPVVLMMRITGQEPDLDGIPGVLRQLIAACLAKQPEDRPTAPELGEMLGPAGTRPPGGPPTENATLTAAPEGPRVPSAGARAPTDKAPAPAVSRRALLTGIAGVVAAGGYGLAIASSPPSDASSRPRQVRPGQWFNPVRWDGVAAAAVDDTTLYLHSWSGQPTGRQEAILALDTATGRERWSVPGRGSTIIGMAMVPVGDALVVGGTGRAMTALNTATGRRRWELPRSVEPHDRAGVAVADGIAVAATNGGLVALDITTGRSIWEAPVGDVSTSDVVARNGVCFTSYYNAAEARELQTGRLLWRNAGPNPLWYGIAGDVIVHYDSGSLVGLDAATGQIRWSLPERSISPPLSLSTFVNFIDDDSVVTSGRDDGDVGVVVAIDPVTGVQRWAHSEPGWGSVDTFAGADGIVCVSNSYGGVRPVAYDITTGVQRWVLDDVFSGSYSVIAARGHEVYLHRFRKGVSRFTIE